MKKAHEKDLLLVRTNPKSIGNKFGWCRSTWKDVDCKVLELLVQRNIVRPAKPKSGGGRSDDEDFMSAAVSLDTLDETETGKSLDLDHIISSEIDGQQKKVLAPSQPIVRALGF